MQVDTNSERSGKNPQSLFLLDHLENQLAGLAQEYAGCVQLIYLDPPFATGDRFSLRQRIGEKGYAGAKDFVLSLDAYADDLPPGQYYAFMRSVLTCCHTLLRSDGSLYLHIDYRTSARMRLLLDEVFGEPNFVNEIIWHYKSGGRSKSHFSRKHDTIFFYRKSKSFYFDINAVGEPRGKESRNHMRKSVDESGRVVFTIKSGGKVYTYDENSPVYPSDVWDDISHLQQKDPERTGYDTQKPEALLRRIIRASSREGDLVADLFSGSGTTAAVAHRLGRRFLAVDACPHALHALRKRLLAPPATLLEPSRFCYELRWNADLISGSPTVRFSCENRKGLTQVTIAGYEAQKSDFTGLPRAKPLDLIDYWAIGSIEDGCFLPQAVAYRSANAGNLSLTLSAPASACRAIQIVDAYGRQGFFSLE